MDLIELAVRLRWFLLGFGPRDDTKMIELIG